MPEPTNGFLGQARQIIGEPVPPAAHIPGIGTRVLSGVADGLQSFVRAINPASWMGPGAGTPSTIPEEVRFRQFDLAPLYNMRMSPKDEGYSCSALRGLAMECTVLGGAVKTVQKQMQRLDWSIQKLGKKKFEGQDNKAREIESFLRYPDREHDFGTWLGMLIEDQLTVDGPTFGYREAKSGKPYSWEVMDPSTVVRLLSSDARTPMPPDPAFKQILKGQSIYYTLGEMLMYPRFPVSWRVYGFSEVEQCIIPANILVRRSLHQLFYYTEGSVPDAFITSPAGTSGEGVKQFQEDMDLKFAGQSNKRRRVHVLPPGFDKVIQTKDAVLTDQTDEVMFRLVCWMFDISPQALVRQLGSKGGAEAQKEISFEEGMLSRMKFWQSYVNLGIRRFWKTDEYGLAWAAEGGGDPEKAANARKVDIASGFRMRNEAREEAGLPPIEGGDEATVDTGGGLVLVKDIPNIKPPADNLEPDAPGLPGPEGTPDPKASAPQPPDGSTPTPGRVAAKQAALSTSEEAIYHHEVDPAHVAEIAKSMKARGYDGPPVLAANHTQSPYLLDGHHRFAAAKQVGIKHVPALIVRRDELDKVLAAHFDGKMPAKLAELDPYIQLPNREDYADMRKVDGIATYDKAKRKPRTFKSPVTAKGRKAERTLARKVGAFFKANKTHLFKTILSHYHPPDVQKADDPKPEMSAGDEEAIAHAVERNLDWSVLVTDTEKALTESATAQAGTLFAQLGYEGDSELIGRVNEQVVAFCRERAAEMVGMKWNADGDLIPNPSAEWAISDTTRDLVRERVTAAFESRMTQDELAENLEDLFDEDRAAKIARQEMRMANTAADYAAFKGAGITGKQWLLSDDYSDADCSGGACGANAAQGIIPMDEDFESGDPYPPQHINCRCSWAGADLAGVTEGDDAGE